MFLDEKKIKENFSLLAVGLKDHWHLLIKSAAENHLRIQECKKIKTGDVCNLEFGSFSELKRYQKKVRLFTYSFSSTFASAIIIAITLNIFLPNSFSQGATVSSHQTDWSGGVSAVAPFPKDPDDKNNNWNKYFSGTNVSHATSGKLTLAPTADPALVESFTSTLKKDVSSTTANWNTVSGKIEPLPEQNANNISQGLNGFYNGTNIIAAMHTAGGLLFTAGSGGKFVKYDTASDIATDLSSSVSSIVGTTQINALRFDGSTYVYLGTMNSGGSPKLLRYKTSDNSVTDLTAKISGFWGANDINSIILDGGGNLYLAGTGGKFAKYVLGDAAAATDLTSTLNTATTWGANAVYRMDLDTVRNTIYLVGSGSKFARLNVNGSVDDLSTVTGFSTAFSTADIQLWSLVVDSSHGVVYIIGNASNNSGRFARYNIPEYSGGGTYPNANTVYELWSKMSSFWPGPYQIPYMHLAFDAANNIIYMGGRAVYSAMMFRYTTTDYNGGGSGSNTVTDISAKVNERASFSIMPGPLVFEPTQKTFYTAAGNKKLLRYNTPESTTTPTYPTVNKFYEVQSVGGIGWGSTAIQSMALGANDWVYFVGGDTVQQGKIARYNLVSGKFEDMAPYAVNIFSNGRFYENISADRSNGGAVYFKIYSGAGSEDGLGRINTPEYNGGGAHPLAGTAYKITPATSFNSLYTTTITDSSLHVLYYYIGTNGLYRYNAGEYSAGSTAYPTANTIYNINNSNLKFGITGSISKLAYDETNRVLYVFTNDAKVYRYYGAEHSNVAKRDTVENITAKFSGVGNLTSVIPKIENNVLYLTGASNKPFRYNTAEFSGGTGTYTSADTVYDLSSALGATGVVFYAKVGELIYGSYGTFGYAVLGSNGSYYKISLKSPDTMSFLTPTKVTGNNGKVFMADNTGPANIGARTENSLVQNVQTTKLNSTSYNIYYATLNHTNTVNTGAVTYYLSNDGGTTWAQVTPGVQHAFATVGSDLRFKATLSYNATIQDITVNYWSYNLEGNAISSPYNTSDANNIFAKLQWTENLPANTDVKYQVRTAPDSAGAPGSWTNWMGPGGDDTTHFTDPTGGESMPTAVSDSGVDGSVSDQWIQYKAILTSDGKLNPEIQDVAMTYVINIAPDVQFTAPISQASDGKITIPYKVRDVDTSSSTNSNGSVIVSLQYCTANCGSAGSETWTTATTATGDLNALAVAPSADPMEDTAYNNYQISWSPKDEYAQRYNGNFKIRLKAFDGEGANMNGYATSAAFELDTRDPIFKATNPILVDRIVNRADSKNAKLTIQKPDSQNNIEDTPFDLYLKQVSPNVDCSNLINGITEADKYQADLFAANTSFNPNKDFDFTIPLLDTDPRKICVRVVDSKGNSLDKEVITPIPPANVKFYDFSQIDSNPANSTFTELIVWDIYNNNKNDFDKYEVYRASKSKTWVEENPASVPDPEEFEKLSHEDATITNINNNYFFDRFTDIADKSNMLDTHYFYKVVVTDKTGSVSALSAQRVADIPNGQGGSDTKAPELTIAPVVNKNVSWAEIDLTTDEIASAQVFYSTDMTLDESGDFTLENSKNVADPSFVTEHKIIVNGLTKNTQYNVLVKVTDPANNFTEKLTTFTTNNGPQISNVTFERNSNTEATIFWATDANESGVQGSTSKVSYSPTKSTDGATLVSPIIEENTDITKTHRITIKNLTPGVRYFFSVSSTRGTDEAIDNNGGLFYNILTTTDSDAPIISDISTPLISYNTVAIQWLTDPQPSVGKVLYRKSSETEFTSTSESFTYDASHYVIIPNLEPDTDYIFKIYARNINGNSTTSPEQNFKTLKDPTFDHAPLSTITFAENNPTVLTDTDAVISFTTDQVANCFVEYGSASGNYGGVPEKEDKDAFNKNHSIHLMSLIFQTKYFYKVTCSDNLETTKDSDEKDFTTKEKNYTAGGIGELLDKVPPTISNVNVADISGESVTITWNTDEKGNSVVGYGVSAANENGASDQVVNSDKNNFANMHTVVVNGLIPGTKYLFKASSTDASGNIGQSAESSFTTASPSSLSSIKAESKDLGQATITWSTSSETTSIVEYGLTTSYEEKKESTTQTKDHSIQLSNLNQGVTYHFRVKGKDSNGRLYASSDQTFEPKSPPQINNISINDITEHEAKVSFETNIPTQATVSYTNISDAGDNGSQSSSEMATKHTIELKNLSQGSTFAIRIKAQDEQGTQSEQQADDLTTGKDENPPKIDMVKTDLALAQNDKVQAIISWSTDEQATTSVLYKEGRNGQPKEVKISDALTPNHIAVLTMFKPGTVYYFNTKSIDASGNVATSSDYALLTPKRRENIIQIIIGNFTDIFGWAKF